MRGTPGFAGSERRITVLSRYSIGGGLEARTSVVFVLPIRRFQQEQSHNEEWKEAPKFKPAFKDSPQGSPDTTRYAGGAYWFFAHKQQTRGPGIALGDAHSDQKGALAPGRAATAGYGPRERVRKTRPSCMTNKITRNKILIRKTRQAPGGSEAWREGLEML